MYIYRLYLYLKTVTMYGSSNYLGLFPRPQPRPPRYANDVYSFTENFAENVKRTMIVRVVEKMKGGTKNMSPARHRRFLFVLRTKCGTYQ